MYFTIERTRIHENSPQAPRDAAGAGALLHRATTLGFRCPPPPTYKSWDGTSNVSWYNDTDTEFHLTTAEQLAGLAEIVNGGNTMAGKTIYLDADLDLAGHEWRSIGIGDNHSLFFGGTFDGQNHYITNLTSKSSADRQGLFGVLSDGALVQNLNILNADIYSANDHLVEGILADWANGSTVLNCYTSGRVESAAGDKMLGGLVGQCTWSSKIIGCGSDAVVVSTYCEGEDCDTVGGLIGQWENSNGDSLISDCWFGGSVSCGYIDSAVGGILGANFDFGGQPGVTIRNCLVSTNDFTCAMPENITFIAAIVDSSVSNCYWPTSLPDGNTCAAVVRLIVDWDAGTAGADPNFDETQCGQPTDDFNSDAIIAALNANAHPGVTWIKGGSHATFSWDTITVPADYTAVDAALDAVNALVRDHYVDLTAVDDAVNAVVRGYSIARQSDVDAMALALQNALNGLVLKDADYTAVDAALAKAAALNRDDYLDLTAVDTAVNAVIRGKKIDEQSVVDAMAKAIEDALAALQTKPTPTPAPTEAPQATAAPTAAPTATAAPTTVPTAAPAVTAAPSVQAASAIPATGDDVNLALLWALLVISGGAAAVLYSKRKRE